MMKTDCQSSDARLLTLKMGKGFMRERLGARKGKERGSSLELY